MIHGHPIGLQKRLQLGRMSGLRYLNKLVANLASRQAKRLESDKRASVCVILRLHGEACQLQNAVKIETAGSDGRKEKRVIVENARTDDHNAGKLECLFIKRAIIQQDPWSGQVALPGGKQEQKDNGSDFNTAVREAHEEIGVDLSDENNFHYLGQLDDRQITGRGKVIKGFAMIPHIFFQTPGQPRPKVKREKAEVAGVRWVDMDIFDESNVQWDLIQRQNYQGGTYLFPSIDLPKEGDVTKTDHLNFYLWGLTYGVTSDLITLMGKQGINEKPYRRTNDDELAKGRMG